MSKQTDKNQVFEKENRILSYSKSILTKSQEEISVEEFRREYEVLSQSYGELLGEVKLLTSVSDRLQNKLNRANESVIKKNEELKETMDMLIKARVGRKATTIVLLIGVIFFLISEWLIDPQLISAGDTSIGTFILIKVGIALALKPMESLIENVLLKTANKPKQE